MRKPSAGEAALTHGARVATAVLIAVVVLAAPGGVGAQPSTKVYRIGVLSAAVMTYGVNAYSLERRRAAYVDRIFRGTRPQDLPVEQPTVYDLVLEGSIRYDAKPGVDRLIRIDYHGSKAVPTGTCQAVLKAAGLRDRGE